VVVTEIVVSAGRTFNHPHEQFSNLKPGVELRARIEDGEDWQQAAKNLQARAEGMIEDHKQAMLKSLRDLEEMTRAQREMADLASSLKDAQDRIALLRERYPDLPGLIEAPADGVGQ
jgi:hypothetical protein